jgi:ribokinase
MSQLVVVGSFNQDHVWRTARFPIPGETRLGVFASGPGGKGFNQAIAAARLGVATHFIGALGDDALGEEAAALAEREGLHAQWQICADHATGTAAILLDDSGQNLIVVGPGANSALSPAHIDACASTLQTARVVLTQQEVNPGATRRALELARAGGAISIHNPAPASAEAPPNELIDVLTPNESEFALWLQSRLGRTIAAEAVVRESDEELQGLCRALAIPTVLITLGAHGVFVSRADGGQRVAAEAVTVRDTTGAGDAFNGALAAAMASGMDLPDAVRQANRVAALKVERAGAALAMPTRAEVRARFGAM